MTKGLLLDSAYALIEWVVDIKVKCDVKITINGNVKEIMIGYGNGRSPK